MKANHLKHLYWRAGFGVGIEKIAELKKRSRKAIVADLFEASKPIRPLALDFTEFDDYYRKNYKELKSKYTREEIDKYRKKNNLKLRELNTAWLERLNDEEAILREKMTLFWANVFVCKDNNTFHIQNYNNTLRSHALGNLRTFVKAIAREASMSKYLNNRQNSKQSPNENFARELMELFTLGIGNYTESDIKAAARAFTGWSFKSDGSFFLIKRRHDYGQKTFFGKTGNFDGDAIIDLILDNKQCAYFICEKIYKYFVNPIPNTRHLKQMTDVFYSDYDIENLMQFVFNADWFYKTENIGVKIKSPVELLLGIQKIVPITFNKPKQLFYLQKMLGQILLYPENVSGWKGDKSWIDSNTLMFRLKLAALLLNNAVINLDEKGTFEDAFEKYYKKVKSRKQFISTEKQWDVFDRFYGKLTPLELKDVLIISTIDNDTMLLLQDLNIANNRDYCIQLMSIPEYQLC